MYTNTDDESYSLLSFIEEKTDEKKLRQRLILKHGMVNMEDTSFWKQFSADKFNTILNMRWWMLILLSLLQYTIINLFFMCLYIVDLNGIGGSTQGYYWDAFFFSFQTISTIGFGHLYPKSAYISIVNYFQAWSGLVTLGVVSAITYAKISRPSRLRHTVAFSNVAVINNETYYPCKTNNDEIEYLKGDSCLLIRFVNIRKRQIMKPSFRLFLLRYHSSNENEELRNASNFSLYELDFEIYDQMPRARAIKFSTPILPFPWTMVHRIDKKSPLYELIGGNVIRDEDFEIISIVEGSDELTGNMFQCRHSYMPDEILFNRRFKKIVTRDSNSGKFKILLDDLSKTEPC